MIQWKRIFNFWLFPQEEQQISLKQLNNKKKYVFLFLEKIFKYLLLTFTTSVRSLATVFHLPQHSLKQVINTYIHTHTKRYVSSCMQSGSLNIRNALMINKSMSNWNLKLGHKLAIFCAVSLRRKSPLLMTF